MPTEVIQRDDKFGISNTYNPYTNSMSYANVNNQRFRIPLTESYANASVVVVSTGLVPNINNVLNGDIVFNLYEDDNVTLIQQLIPKVVDVGSGQYPARNEINWFDIIGMQGDFMVHSDWCGKILEISGKIETCSITAEDINGINKDINGINKDINGINKNIKDNYNDLLDRINRKGANFRGVTWSWALNERGVRRSGWYGNAASFIPDKFIGSVIVSGTAYASVSSSSSVTATAKIGIAFGNPSGRIELTTATTTTTAAAPDATAAATATTTAVAACMNMNCYISAYASFSSSSSVDAAAYVGATAGGYIIS